MWWVLKSKRTDIGLPIIAQYFVQRWRHGSTTEYTAPQSCDVTRGEIRFSAECGEVVSLSGQRGWPLLFYLRGPFLNILFYHGWHALISHSTNAVLPSLIAYMMTELTQDEREIIEQDSVADALSAVRQALHEAEANTPTESDDSTHSPQLPHLFVAAIENCSLFSLPPICLPT